MDMKGREELMEKWKDKAEILRDSSIPAFIRDIDDNLYFCDIIVVGEKTITIHCFGPEQRAGRKYILYWALIETFREYKEEVAQ